MVFEFDIMLLKSFSVVFNQLFIYLHIFGSLILLGSGGHLTNKKN